MADPYLNDFVKKVLSDIAEGCKSAKKEHKDFFEVASGDEAVDFDIEVYELEGNIYVNTNGRKEHPYPSIKFSVPYIT